jgi:hypothetical protein
VKCHTFFACDDVFPTSWLATPSMNQQYPIPPNQPPTLEPAMLYPQRQESFGDSNLDQKETETHDAGIDGLSGSASSFTILIDGASVDHRKSMNGAPSEMGNHSRRGPFKDPHVRAQTAQTRKDNACLRCRMQRIRVGVHPGTLHLTPTDPLR